MAQKDLVGMNNSQLEVLISKMVLEAVNEADLRDRMNTAGFQGDKASIRWREPVPESIVGFVANTTVLIDHPFENDLLQTMDPHVR